MEEMKEVWQSPPDWHSKFFCSLLRARKDWSAPLQSDNQGAKTNFFEQLMTSTDNDKFDEGEVSGESYGMDIKS